MCYRVSSHTRWKLRHSEPCFGNAFLQYPSFRLPHLGHAHVAIEFPLAIGLLGNHKRDSEFGSRRPSVAIAQSLNRLRTVTGHARSRTHSRTSCGESTVRFLDLAKSERRHACRPWPEVTSRPTRMSALQKNRRCARGTAQRVGFAPSGLGTVPGDGLTRALPFADELPPRWGGGPPRHGAFHARGSRPSHRALEMPTTRTQSLCRA